MSEIKTTLIDELTGDEIYPNIKIENIPLNSIGHEQITPASITGTDIAEGTITGDNVEPGSLNTAVFTNNCITVDKLADNAVETSKIKNGAVTFDKNNTHIFHNKVLATTSNNVTYSIEFYTPTEISSIINIDQLLYYLYMSYGLTASVNALDMTTSEGDTILLNFHNIYMNLSPQEFRLYASGININNYSSSAAYSFTLASYDFTSFNVLSSVQIR